MTSFLKRIAAAFAVLSLGASLQAGEVNWTDNIQTAKTNSETSKLPVLALFTGSDWCPACKALEGNILSDKEVQEFINSKFSPFKADFPRRHKLQPGVARQNEKLAADYGIDAFPTLVIMDKNGKKLAKFFNESSTPRDFIKQLKKELSKLPKGAFGDNGASAKGKRQPDSGKKEAEPQQ